MAINQTKIFDDLQKLTNKTSAYDFIYEFLKIFDFPKSTITRLKKLEDNPLNVAESPQLGEIAIKQVLYFKPVFDGGDVYEELLVLRESQIVKAHKIRFCILCNGRDFTAYDFRYDEILECAFEDIYKNYTFFLPLVNIERSREFIESFADVKASEKLGRLFDVIKQTNHIESLEDIHNLNVFLTRLLFCFFAEDTGIFTKNLFTNTLEGCTNKNGDNFSEQLSQIFAIMNVHDHSQLRKIAPVHINNFPYVNGGLFEKNLPIPEFTGRTRRLLLDCGKLEWSEINPDIFGSMFQAVINPEQRRNHGQHYTSVPNIMKVINPLFVEPLEAEFKKIKAKPDQSKRLKALHEFSMRLGNIKFFDPACGSGNFLIISYKEIRRIEMEVFKELQKIDSGSLFYSSIKLDQFYGIEIDDFAYEIAILSLWLTEHQVNVQFKAQFGDCTPTLPLKQSGNILHGNSLRNSWIEFVERKSPYEEVYLIGNPPFGGKQERTENQTEDMALVFKENPKHKIIDYVSCWFLKGADYISGTNAKLSFVTTNSITQGEQVSILWEPIFKKNVSIEFAYKAFTWKNNAKQNAGVHVSIISLADDLNVPKLKTIYSEIDGNSHSEEVSNISPYLVEGSNCTISTRSTPLSENAPKISFGNMPNDGGNLILSTLEKDHLIQVEPNSEKWIKKLLGAEEFINGSERWCLWLEGITEVDLDDLPLIRQRVEAVKKFRSESKRKETRILASTPHLFGEIRQDSKSSFILIPCHSSENRDYLPVGFMDSSCISTNANLIVPNASLYDLGILMSAMHNDWMRVVCGRIKSDYRYSASIVYNNFPWPLESLKSRKIIEGLAEEILLIREDFPDKTLAELYDPNKMPEQLQLAHSTLDNAVDQLYRSRMFNNSSERTEHLFALYVEEINKLKTMPIVKKNQLNHDSLSIA